MEFTHFDNKGHAVMVDVSAKPFTDRIAVASGKIKLAEEAYHKIKIGGVKKGDVLGVARLAGIMGAKKTSDLIPLCHPIFLSGISIDFEFYDADLVIKVIVAAKTSGPTGVEMEALTAVNITLLTIYDMCKAIDKNMEFYDIHLDSKSGGKSGDFRRQ